ncbi:hypothetical protein JK358_38380 [Nocardia sp. 2]|uniref:ATP-grasp domain-containing protein n=1 Tax=Nocardia acididurans TaxID=2802282 RepID=A0ABS1MJR1_9NOCA|nr:hypothetical protein [Nocardia acididurans]MBL1080280.1 hypothetical protein [Nocardia acididurans]
MPFAERIDHSQYAVTYVTIRSAQRTVPPEATAVIVIEDLAYAAKAVRDLVSTYGRPERIIARGEYDLMTAAALRMEFGVDGDLPEHVVWFRDKLVMCEAVQAAGVDVPEFGEVRTDTEVASFAEAHGFPVVVKPRLGATSRDVVIIESHGELAALPDLSAEPFLVQRFCPDPVGHIDGIWTGTELAAWRVSRYVDTCLSFATGGATLGSVELDDPALRAQAEELAVAVCLALSKGRPQAFHLEYFLGYDDSGRPQLRFLEVAARVGGTEIAYIWRDVHQFDLLGASLDIQLGRTPEPHVFPEDVVGGFVVIRPSVPPPCVVIDSGLEITPALGRTLYDGEVPARGAVITASEGYVGVGAAFRFRGDSTVQVMDSIAQARAGFHMICVPQE